MALNLMTRKVQGVPAQSARVLCTPRVTVTRRSTIMRYKEDERSDNAQANSATPRDMAKPTSYPHADAVNVSPEIAERRADLGKDASLGQIQAFDGPAPETINGRLCMLAVPLCLWWEAVYGQDVVAQVKDHPYSVLAVFVIISLASYIPIVRGYTRKEPFANQAGGFNWTPKAENWNGRIAMLGFTGILITEAYTMMPTWQFWAEKIQGY